MTALLQAPERQSFMLFAVLIFITAFLSWLGQGSPVFLAILSVMLGFFGLYRLTYFLEGGMQTLPAFFTLPARLLFGLNQTEESYKQAVLKRLQQKDIIIWFVLGLIYSGWIIFCGFGISSPENFLLLFEKNIPDISAFSYLNFYEMMRGLLSFILSGLIFFLALSYSQSSMGCKKLLLFFLPCFSILFFLCIMTADFVFSLPPLHTDLLQGMGLGKGSLLFTAQPEIFPYPPTPLFIQYIETGLVGIGLFYAVFAPILWRFIQAIISFQTNSIYAVIGLVILFLLFILNGFMMGGDWCAPLQILGIVIIGLCWGACFPNKKT